MLLLATLAATAAEQPPHLRGVLRVGTPGDYAPYALRNADGLYTGADIALARELAMELGLGLQMVHTSWGTLLADATTGKFDIAVGGVSITPERERRVRFSQPYSRDHKSPLTRCGEQERFDTQAEIDRPEVRLIVNAGGTNERLAREKFPHADLNVLADNRAVFAEIAAGRADVMVTDAVEARLQSAQDPRLCVAEAAPDWEPRDKAVLVNGDFALAYRVDEAMKRVLSRQSYPRRLEQWLARDWRSADGQVRLEDLIDQRLAVMVEVARWKWNRKAAIEDLPRERSLLAAMDAGARTRGIDPLQVATIFSAQIEAAKQLQRELFARWQREGQGEFAGVSELDSVLRPQIDGLNQRMLDAMRARRPGGTAPVSPAALTMGGISPEALRLALGPLQDR